MSQASPLPHAHMAFEEFVWGLGQGAAVCLWVGGPGNMGDQPYMEPSGNRGLELWTLTAIWSARLRSHSLPPGLLSGCSRPVTPPSTGLVV